MFGYLGGINRYTHSGNAFGEKSQNGIVYVIINQDKRCFSCTDQVGCEFVGIKQLTVIKNAFYRRQGGFDKEVDFLVMFG